MSFDIKFTRRGLPSDSKCVLKALPGKLDIKRSEPGILFISLPIVSLFKLEKVRIFVFLNKETSNYFANLHRKISMEFILISVIDINGIYIMRVIQA